MTDVLGIPYVMLRMNDGNEIYEAMGLDFREFGSPILQNLTLPLRIAEVFQNTIYTASIHLHNLFIIQN